MSNNNSIGGNNGGNNKGNKPIQSNYWIWLIVYIGIGLVISFIVPFPISFLVALLVFFLLNAVRTHIALKRHGVAGGIKELYKSLSSSLGAGGFAYSPIKYYCMNCSYEHKKDSCPKCGSKAVRIE
jgi:hypothetical protein